MRFSVLVATAVMLLVGCQRDGETSPAPPDVWKPIFYTSIDRLTDHLNLPKLRNAQMTHDDIELRVWIGFGLARLQGVRILRKGDNWSAYYLRENSDGLSGTISKRSPASDWNDFWNTLIKSGLLTLPDQSELESVVVVLDGVSYVVELIIDDRYRTYMYSDPDSQRGSEAKQMLEIIGTIKTELLGGNKPLASHRQS